MTSDRWVDRAERSARARGVDADQVRQIVGYASRFADVCGHELDAYDVLDALRDTGLLFVRDSEGFASDAARWAVMVIAADVDPLDHDPPIDTHWDQEVEDREAAAMRPRRRTEEDK